MNKLLFFSAFIFSLTIISCNFSKGVKKEMGTGLYTSYNGFGVGEIYLTDDSGNRLSDNKVKLGTKLALVATGVDSYKEKDGRVFPGCSIVLTDKTGQVLLNLPEAFTNMDDGTTASEAKILQVSLNTGDPMVVGETYHLSARFFDKNNSENEIIANVDLLMKE